jgi:hypothetical protein
MSGFTGEAPTEESFKKSLVGQGIGTTRDYMISGQQTKRGKEEMAYGREMWEKDKEGKLTDAQGEYIKMVDDATNVYLHIARLKNEVPAEVAEEFSMLSNKPLADEKAYEIMKNLQIIRANIISGDATPEEIKYITDAWNVSEMAKSRVPTMTGAPSNIAEFVPVLTRMLVNDFINNTGRQPNEKEMMEIERMVRSYVESQTQQTGGENAGRFNPPVFPTK